jgi:hypothetical protein
MIDPFDGNRGLLHDGLAKEREVPEIGVSSPDFNAWRRAAVGQIVSTCWRSFALAETFPLERDPP